MNEYEIRRYNGKIEIDDTAQIHRDTLIEIAKDEGEIKIGKLVCIGRRSTIAAAKYIEIKDYAMLAPSVYVCDSDHEYRDVNIPIRFQPLIEPTPLIIGENSWIGIHAVILASVGKGSVVGANSVVTKEIPDYCVAVGSPAKVIKKYNHTTKEWQNVM